MIIDDFKKENFNIENFELYSEKKYMKLLSYPVMLTGCETLILKVLLDTYGRFIPAAELAELCGEKSCTQGSVVTHISAINQKAAPIISRQLVLCHKGDGYILNNQI